MNSNFALAKISRRDTFESVFGEDKRMKFAYVRKRLFSKG